MPRALPDALLEGLAWDAVGRRYETLSGVLAYSARVAAAVGAMMCVLMRVRDADALARACDLGLAMQLTNIARDVGEDARAGRPLPAAGLAGAEGVDPEHFLADPRRPRRSAGSLPAFWPRQTGFMPGRGRGACACRSAAGPAFWPPAHLCRDRRRGGAERP